MEYIHKQSIIHHQFSHKKTNDSEESGVSRGPRVKWLVLSRVFGIKKSLLVLSNHIKQKFKL